MRSGLSGLNVERPENADFESVYGIDVVACGEVVRMAHRPSSSNVLELEEDTCAFPLYVDESVDSGTVFV